ncbi:hypothetical protein C3F09_01790 [candidate division GN15 bacterium]|uniref:TonB C-terminal domain-containing protein n=1 Tax=candidate division GN15 bacterium TaxID=2072418 RepID=A0A855XC65_9BACT|nr:MAG: hypothetical protein C3F09_01790 [candidate division GN15 bacterium]
MVHAAGVPYSAYGAYELKATYQRNMLAGALCSATIGLVVGIILWAIQTPVESVAIQPRPPAWVDHGPRPLPPPSIQPGPAGPKQPSTPVGGYIPRPVDGDDREGIDTVVIISPGNIDYGDLRDSGSGPAMPIDTGIQDAIPDRDSFIALEYLPEIISRSPVYYPEVAKRAGMTGTVTLQVLLGTRGEPLQAVVGRSCGWKILDEAALAGAFRNTYKPGIQNGRPVMCWISYRVDFSLERED